MSLSLSLSLSLSVSIASTINSEQGVCHTVALPFTLKFILREKKNYENSNISPCKNIHNLQKNPNIGTCA
jgi:hypothetical protein